MRILIIPSWYPSPERPVNGVFVRSQVDALSRRHEVYVLYLDVMRRGQRRAPSHTVTNERGYTEERIEVPNVRFVWQFLYLLMMARALIRIRRTFRPHVLHAHIAVPAGWAVSLIGRLVGLPVVLTENSSELRSWQARPGLRMMARMAYALADVVIAVSEGQWRRILAAFPRRKPTILIPNLVDTGRFMPTPFPATSDGFRLLFVGLMDTNQKGVDTLLKALAIIVSGDAPRIHVDIAGEGALRAGYERQAQELGLGGEVRFHGAVSQEAVREMLAACHALVLPSRHEALPLVVIEALASGRPVVATRSGGPEFMLDATNGLLVESEVPRELAAAIASLLANLDRYDPERIAASAKEKYGAETVVERLTEVYRSVARRRRGE